MYTDGTPTSPYLAKWSCTVETLRHRTSRRAHCGRARATLDNWGLGGLANDVALIVAEFSSNAWTHGSPPVEVTLLLQDTVLTIEVSDAEPAWQYSPGPAR